MSATHLLSEAAQDDIFAILSMMSVRYESSSTIIGGLKVSHLLALVANDWELTNLRRKRYIILSECLITAQSNPPSGGVFKDHLDSGGLLAPPKSFWEKTLI